jgi:4-diphosphocytidyl-2-C-methyl-D-erythritol kinase
LLFDGAHLSTQPLLAPAKINLCFEILGRHDDDYHEVRTVYQAIGLMDQLEFEPAGNLLLEVAPRGAAPVDDNLVLQAARLLQSETHTSKGARVQLTKRIPVAAGLGGGSSDAAATLMGLRSLWGLDVPEERLLELAAQLGADVPFFIRGGTALGAGRGEMLTPLVTPTGMWAVVLCPGDGGDNKTARLYGMITPDHYSRDGSATERIVQRVNAGEALNDCLFNTFETVAASAYPGYVAARAAFLDAGAANVHLAGAGPSLFAVVATGGEAAALRDKLSALKLTAFAAPFLPV